VKIFRSLDNIDIEKPILTIGSFDGVHLGHRQVIDKLKQEAARLHGQSTVFTFWPHPSLVLHPEQKLQLLSTLDEKVLLLEQTGIDNLILLPFSTELSQMEYTDFVKLILVGKLHIATLLLGYDNKMGRGGKGQYREIELLAKEFGFSILKMNAVSAENKPISSTKIRELLSVGNVSAVTNWLGRPYSLTGKVVKGNQIGTKIGFPTANLQPDACKFVPCNGVYAITTQIADNEYYGMLNIGVRPTLKNGSSDVSIEAHIFGFEGDLYGENLTVQFIGRIRSERQFVSIDELKSQLQTDSILVKSCLKTVK